MDWLGLSLLVAGALSVLIARQMLTAGAAKTSVDAAATLRNKYAALRRWTLPVMLVLLLGFKSTPMLQAGVLVLLVSAAEGWTYRTAQILAIPIRYKHAVALSSVLAVTAVGGYFAVLLVRHVATA